MQLFQPQIQLHATAVSFHIQFLSYFCKKFKNMDIFDNFPNF